MELFYPGKNDVFHRVTGYPGRQEGNMELGVNCAQFQYLKGLSSCLKITFFRGTLEKMTSHDDNAPCSQTMASW